MKQKRLLELIEKISTGQATAADIKELDLLYLEYENKPGYVDSLVVKQQEAYKEVIYGRIHSRINEPEQPLTLAINKSRKQRWTRISIAASIAFCLSLGAYYLLNQASRDRSANHAEDILPGKQSATLTLDNGKTVTLSTTPNGKVALQSGVSIQKTANGQLIYTTTANDTKAQNKNNTLSTGRGEQFQLILPDGSQVWLNAASALTYPVSFASSRSREVKLKGEAYFEISKDKAHPFVVTTDKQQVEVLGTHFNINSYEDEAETKTTLLEGSIQVTAVQNLAAKVLTPGQQATLSTNNLIVTAANVAETIAWKNGDFNFNGESIQSIMRKLSRWYNVEVRFQGAITSKTFTGKISRSRNITEVLKILEKTKAVHFKIEERSVIVTD